MLGWILCIFVLPGVQILGSHVELEDWPSGSAFGRWEKAGCSHQNATRTENIRQEHVFCFGG